MQKFKANPPARIKRKAEKPRFLNSAFKRDSSLEGPENFQGENGGGGFNPPGGSY